MAQTLARNGRYTEAIAQYQQILQEKPSATAWLRLGELHTAEGDYAGAIASLQQFVTDPDAEPYPQALFLLATAHRELEQWEQALEYYKVYGAQRDVIADYVNEFRGDVYMELQNYPAAVAAYAAALRENITGARQVHIREQIAIAYRRQRNFDAALAQYRAILDVAKLHFYRAKIEYEVAWTYLEADKTAAAYERMKVLIYEYPETGAAYQSLIALLDAGIAVDEYQRGLVDYYNDAYEPAIRAFYRHIEANPETHNGNPHYYAALAYQGLGDYESAINELKVLIDTHPGDARTSAAWMELARSWARLDNYNEATQVYDQFARTYPQDALADDMLWQQAEWAYDWGRYADAAPVYRRLQESYPGSDYAARAFFQRGLCYYLLEKYSDAAEAFEGLQLRYPHSAFAEKARFWQAKSLLMAEKEAEAQTVLEELVAEGDWDYYVWRGRELLAEIGGTTIAPTATVSPPISISVSISISLPLPAALLSDAARTGIDTWLRSWVRGAPEGELHLLSAQITGNVHYQRGLELWQVGLREEAMDEFKELRDTPTIKENALANYQLATFFREMGINHYSIVCIERLVNMSPATDVSDENIPAPLREWVFPAFYSDLILPEAQKQEIDPLLFFALVRQESHFYSAATSSAAAQGLSQVMPSTGAWIAERLGKTDFDAVDLYKPYVNVEFGIWFLRAALQMFDGNVFSALAGYNAGPGRVEQWRDIAGDDDDLFVEIIPLTETRMYLRNVYPFYRWYQVVYGKNE